MNSKNPVVWFEIYVEDLNRAQRFYENVLNLKLQTFSTPDINEDMQMMAFPMEMDGAGASGALVKMEGVKAGANSTLIYFKSEDCSIESARIESAGGQLYKSKQSIGEYGFMVLGIDTEGNMFGIHSNK